MQFQKKNRSAFSNFLRSKYEMYSGEIDVKSLPYFIGIDPSDICQLRCTTCPTGIDNERKKQKTEGARFRSERAIMAPEVFDSLLGELGEYLFSINFYNYGEPLLNKHLPEFIRQAKAFDIFTEVHSNLSLPLTDARIDALLTSGLDYLSASADGFSQETYQVHRVGGNLALVKQNLERLAAARARLGSHTEIVYSILVFKFNEHELPAARAYCDDLGIKFESRDAFIDERSWLPSYRSDEKPYQLDPQARIKENVTESWWPLPQLSDAQVPSACAWHYGYSVVTAGGPVAPCCVVAKEEHDMGTIIPGRVSFADVWNGDFIRKSRADFAGKTVEGLEKLETVCTRCPYSKPIQHLYSARDVFVLRQFQDTFGESEPLLTKAFDLLSRIRYGTPLERLYREGIPSPREQLFVGTEGNNEPAQFMKYVAESLLTKPALFGKS